MGDAPIRSESFGCEQDWIQTLEDPFGSGGLVSVGLVDKAGKLVEETARMAEELLDVHIDIASIMAVKLEEFHASGSSCVTSGAMEKLMHKIVLDVYTEHKRNLEAEVNAAEDIAKKEVREKIIAEAVMKKTVEKALAAQPDGASKDVLVWKLEEMVAKSWPIYHILAEKKPENVLAAVAQQYAKYRDTMKIEENTH